jgi:hypothetical protein
MGDAFYIGEENQLHEFSAPFMEIGRLTAELPRKPYELSEWEVDAEADAEAEADEQYFAEWYEKEKEAKDGDVAPVYTEDIRADVYVLHGGGCARATGARTKAIKDGFVLLRALAHRGMVLEKTHNRTEEDQLESRYREFYVPYIGAGDKVVAYVPGVDDDIGTIRGGDWVYTKKWSMPFGAEVGCVRYGLVEHIEQPDDKGVMSTLIDWIDSTERSSTTDTTPFNVFKAERVINVPANGYEFDKVYAATIDPTKDQPPTSLEFKLHKLRPNDHTPIAHTADDIALIFLGGFASYMLHKQHEQVQSEVVHLPLDILRLYFANNQVALVVYTVASSIYNRMPEWFPTDERGVFVFRSAETEAGYVPITEHRLAWRALQTHPAFQDTCTLAGVAHPAAGYVGYFSKPKGFTVVQMRQGRERGSVVALREKQVRYGALNVEGRYVVARSLTAHSTIGVAQILRSVDDAYCAVWDDVLVQEFAKPYRWMQVEKYGYYGRGAVTPMKLDILLDLEIHTVLDHKPTQNVDDWVWVVLSGVVCVPNAMITRDGVVACSVQRGSEVRRVKYDAVVGMAHIVILGTRGADHVVARAGRWWLDATLWHPSDIAVYVSQTDCSGTWNGYPLILPALTADTAQAARYRMDPGVLQYTVPDMLGETPVSTHVQQIVDGADGVTAMGVPAADNAIIAAYGRLITSMRWKSVERPSNTVIVVLARDEGGMVGRQLVESENLTADVVAYELIQYSGHHDESYYCRKLGGERAGKHKRVAQDTELAIVCELTLDWQTSQEARRVWYFKLPVQPRGVLNEFIVSTKPILLHSMPVGEPGQQRARFPDDEPGVYYFLSAAGHDFLSRKQPYAKLPESALLRYVLLTDPSLFACVLVRTGGGASELWPSPSELWHDEYDKVYINVHLQLAYIWLRYLPESTRASMLMDEVLPSGEVVSSLSGYKLIPAAWTVSATDRRNDAAWDAWTGALVKDWLYSGTVVHSAAIAQWDTMMASQANIVTMVHPFVEDFTRVVDLLHPGDRARTLNVAQMELELKDASKVVDDILKAVPADMHQVEAGKPVRWDVLGVRVQLFMRAVDSFMAAPPALFANAKKGGSGSRFYIGPGSEFAFKGMGGKSNYAAQLATYQEQMRTAAAYLHADRFLGIPDKYRKSGKDLVHYGETIWEKKSAQQVIAELVTLVKQTIE